ncbi:MAG: BadF/BadG/BcrA/BcrD ATPase family protein [Atribacterota bacterium]
MEYLLGVDGGGSKTIGILMDINGELKAVATSGPVNLAENGEKMVRENVRRLRSLLNRVSPSDIIYSSFGMPAFGEWRKADQEYRTILVEELGITPTLLVNDVVVGWAAGTLGEDGIHVVAGTGTIAYGRHGKKEARVSGWGSIIGDEGSAYALGQEALRRISRQFDGRELPTLLKELFCQRLRWTSWQDLTEWIYSHQDAERRTVIAALAPVVYEAGQKGDPVAREIMDNAAQELSLCAKTLIRLLSLPRPLVTYSGSVLTKNEIVRQRFMNDLYQSIPQATVKESELHPALGAIILLYREIYGVLPQILLPKLSLVSQQFFSE